MVDSKYSSDNYETIETNIRTIITDPEILRFIPNYLGTKKCVKMQLKIDIRDKGCS